MERLSSTRRTLLDIQGFDDLDEATLVRTQRWLRLAPALCASAILPLHPFDLIYQLGVRRITGGPLLPGNHAPRRFACGLASAWLAVTGAMFYAGYDIAGYVLGATMVGIATLMATTHICIPSMIFRTACGQMPAYLPRRGQSASHRDHAG